MPNWCEGVLKVRGKKKDLKNFLQNEIERIGYASDFTCTQSPLNIEINEFGDYNVNINDDTWLYFKGSRRLFVTQSIQWYLEELYDEEEAIECIDVKQAWDLDSDWFVEKSKLYNIDFKITGFEQGMEFSRDIEVVKGKLICDVKREYEDYEWECYDPRLGG